MAWKQCALVFTSALLIRLVHLWQMRRAPVFTVLMGDARSYDEWAQRIAGGDWLGTDVFYQAPLYPYFLGAIYSLFDRDLVVVRICQAVIGAGSCAMLAAAAQRLFSPRAGLVAGLGLAFYAPAIFFDALIQKTVLDVFLVCLALLILSRLTTAATSTRHWVGLGVVLGCLILTRENAVVFAAIVLLWALVRSISGTPAAHAWRGRIREMAAFLLGLAVVLGPVATRNYLVSGGLYVTTSQFGPNFYIGNNPRADGTYMSLRPGRGAPEYERQDATELAERALGRSLTPSDVSSYWTDRALDFISSHPGAWIALVGRKLLLLWNADEMLDTESLETHAESSLILRIGGWIGHFGVLVPIALLGVIATWGERRRLWLFYLMTLGYAASVIVFYVFARYRFPLVPFLMLFAAVGMVNTPLLIGTSSRARRGMLAAGVGAAAVVANWPVLSSAMMRAITENNLAVAMQEAGQRERAIEHYRRAVEIRGDYAPAYNNMGTALRGMGRVDEAIAAYSRALQVMPDYPDAHYNLANALMDLNRPDEAVAHLVIAAAALPSSPGVHNNLGKALAEKGQLAEAAIELRTAVALEPGSARAHHNLGNVLASQGRINEALGHLRQAVDLEPGNPDAGYDLGTLLLEIKRPEAAVEAFRAVIAVRPDYAEAHNNLGIAMGSQGRLLEAIGHFEQALRLKPGYADAQRNLDMAKRARND